MQVREDRKLNQTEMAELLGLSQSGYSRIERNETSVDIEDVVRFSKILQVPVQEFLPETMSIHYENHNGTSGPNLIFGDFHYSPQTDTNTQQLLSALAVLIEKLDGVINKNKE